MLLRVNHPKSYHIATQLLVDEMMRNNISTKHNGTIKNQLPVETAQAMPFA